MSDEVKSENKELTEHEKAVRQKNWELFGLLFTEWRKINKVTHEAIERASLKYPEIHVGQLLMIGDMMGDHGDDQHRLFVSDIVEAQKMSPQMLSRILRTLEQDKVIERHSDPEDRRRAYVIITDLGGKVLGECGRNLSYITIGTFQRIGYDRIERVLRDMKEIVDAMDDIASMDIEEVIKEVESHDKNNS